MFGGCFWCLAMVLLVLHSGCCSEFGECFIIVLQIQFLNV